MNIESAAFKNGEYIPNQYTCKGVDISPEIKWSDLPKNTRSLVLIMDDPDAPMGTWVHWVVYNIPANVKSLNEEFSKKAILDDGTAQGMTSFRRIGYGGPCPPPGPAHRYFFKLYALDTVLDLPPGVIKGEVEKAMEGHIIESAEIMGLFKR